MRHPNDNLPEVKLFPSLPDQSYLSWGLVAGEYIDLSTLAGPRLTQETWGITDHELLATVDVPQYETSTWTVWAARYFIFRAIADPSLDGEVGPIVLDLQFQRRGRSVDDAAFYCRPGTVSVVNRDSLRNIGAGTAGYVAAVRISPGQTHTFGRGQRHGQLSASGPNVSRDHFGVSVFQGGEASVSNYSNNGCIVRTGC